MIANDHNFELCAKDYLEAKGLYFSTWLESVSSRMKGDVLAVYGLSMLLDIHTVMHLRNGATWSTLKHVCAMHDENLDKCQVHMVYVGQGLFVELVKRDKSLQILPGPDKNVQSLVVGELTVELAILDSVQLSGVGVGIDRTAKPSTSTLTASTTYTSQPNIAEPTTSTSTAKTTLVKLSVPQTLKHTPMPAAASTSSEQTRPVHNRVDKEKVAKIVLKKLSLGPKDQILITQDIMDSIPWSRYRPSSLYIPVAEYGTMPDTKAVSSGEETVMYSSTETELYWLLDTVDKKPPASSKKRLIHAKPSKMY